jgi:hypothetical protein
MRVPLRTPGRRANPPSAGSPDQRHDQGLRLVFALTAGGCGSLVEDRLRSEMAALHKRLDDALASDDDDK